MRIAVRPRALRRVFDGVRPTERRDLRAEQVATRRRVALAAGRSADGPPRDGDGHLVLLRAVLLPAVQIGIRLLYGVGNRLIRPVHCQGRAAANAEPDRVVGREEVLVITADVADELDHDAVFRWLRPGLIRWRLKCGGLRACR